MTDLTPPPERDLRPGRRRAIRAVLTAKDVPAARARLVPAMIAAGAVVAVVAATVAVRAATDDDQPPVTSRPTATPSVPYSATPTYTEPAPTKPSRKPPVGTVFVTEPPQQALAICRDVLRGRGGPDLTKLKVTAVMTGRWGTSMVLTDGRMWAGCDTAGSKHNHPSLRQPEPVQVPSVTNNDAFAVSAYKQSESWQPNSKWYDYYWAAGIVPDGVAEIVYTFPDGKTAKAVFNGPYWLMQRAYTKPWKEGTDVNLRQIQVTLKRDDGSVIRTFPLSWGSQTCAAISHGC